MFLFTAHSNAQMAPLTVGFSMKRLKPKPCGRDQRKQQKHTDQKKKRARTSGIVTSGASGELRSSEPSVWAEAALTRSATKSSPLNATDILGRR